MSDPLAPRVPTVPAVRTRRAPVRSDGIRTVTPEPVEPTAFDCPRGYGECEDARECVYPGRCGRVILEERITIVRRWLVTEAA